MVLALALCMDVSKLGLASADDVPEAAADDDEARRALTSLSLFCAAATLFALAHTTTRHHAPEEMSAGEKRRQGALRNAIWRPIACVGERQTARDKTRIARTWPRKQLRESDLTSRYSPAAPAIFAVTPQRQASGAARATSALTPQCRLSGAPASLVQEA